jgi:hypothetical protein
VHWHVPLQLPWHLLLPLLPLMLSQAQVVRLLLLRTVLLRPYCSLVWLQGLVG